MNAKLPSDELLYFTVPVPKLGGMKSSRCVFDERVSVNMCILTLESLPFRHVVQFIKHDSKLLLFTLNIELNWILLIIYGMFILSSPLSFLVRRWLRYWATLVSTPSFMFPCSRPQTASWWTWRENIALMTFKEWWTSWRRGKTVFTPRGLRCVGRCCVSRRSRSCKV